ncbi:MULTISPECIES: hypothetical protein [unclassified Lentimonas]|nr:MULTISPECIES: hypothetical protein [unclassified Lentimonas]
MNRLSSPKSGDGIAMSVPLSLISEDSRKSAVKNTESKHFIDTLEN